MFGRMKDPVEGTATVIGYSERHEQKGDRVVLDAQVIIEAPGMASATVDAKPEVPQSWMPVKTGTTWPVRVDRANPSRLKFLWDRVAPPAGTAPTPMGPAVIQSVQSYSLPAQIQVMGDNLDPAEYKAAIQMAEHATGMDLDGDGRVAGKAAAPGAGASPFAEFFQQAAAAAGAVPGVPASAPASPTSDDPVSRLERLAKLLDEGAITREEFDAQKKQILGSG
jgi:hypothetical protein